MTPKEFKATRRDLGLSLAEVADAFRVESDRQVRRWETGERDIPGPAQVLMDLLGTHPDLLEEIEFDYRR
tara:strand:- start:845 stop:1054 length:210 start_codon:yes stop_codon:yes gene_type:complete